MHLTLKKMYRTILHSVSIDTTALKINMNIKQPNRDI